MDKNDPAISKLFWFKIMLLLWNNGFLIIIQIRLLVLLKYKTNLPLWET